MAVSFTSNGNWDREFKSNAGMTGKFLRKTAQKVATKAGPKVGSKYGTGELARSIAVVDGRNHVLGPQVFVDAQTSYAVYHHEGYQPFQHTEPAGEVMVFPSKGGMVFTPSVSHPGWRGNPFLWDALVEVIVGGRVVSPHSSRG